MLRQMDLHFSNSKLTQRVFVLYGLGGSGKSQIAFKFVDQCQLDTKPCRCASFLINRQDREHTTDFRCGSSFSEVIIVDASSELTLTSDLANVATVKNVGKTAEDGLRWFETHREKWLLIFDNADDISLNLGKYIPRVNHGNIIITTRNQSARHHASPSSSVDVTVMGLEDATDLLLNVAGLDSDNKSAAAGFVQESDLLTIYENRGTDVSNRNWDVMLSP